MLLAIETSCDESAIAVLDTEALENGSKKTVSEALAADVIASQVDVHKAYGGVVPELAAREHLVNLPLLLESALKSAGIDEADITSLAVTQGPGLKGCLLVGVCFAKAFALSRGIPLIPVHHIEGHLFAGDLLPEQSQPQLPMLALVVSGGHTQLVYVEGFRRYRIVANTRDDAAGEAFDKAATLLGLSYPGGPALARKAEAGDPQSFPLPVALKQDSSSFSFSGLKTALSRTIIELGSRESRKLDDETTSNLAASLQSAIVKALVSKTLSACRLYQPKSVLLTGGVAANESLQKNLALELENAGIKFSVPERKWCTDNAAMIAAVAYRQLRLCDSREKLQDFEFPALPRWPLTELAL